jgi:3-hydroxyisobutyrate dehydrogenase-like beta-hydroxyacid dehydrogenase
MTIRNVGLIGVGLMGHGIGKNILAKGFALNVMAHKNRAPVESLISLGARECASPAEIAKASDLVILCVTGTPQVEEAVYGAKGLATALRDGLIIADCSTAEPASTIRIAADLKAKGVHFVDTPMTRTPKEAEAGKLGLMVAGPTDVLAKIRPVLDCFADTIVNAGAAGAAHQLKLLAAEAITVAAKAGVKMEAFRDIVMAGGAASVMFGRLINVPLSDDDSSAKFAIKNARKDMRYYTNMTEQLPVASFMGESVHQLFVMAENMGFGDRFIPRMIDVFQKINGMKK